MNYGLYLSAAGALTSMHRQDVIANNLANINTVGFKPDQVYTRARLPERIESPHRLSDPQWMLEQLGGGKLVEPTQTSFAQGELVRTGNALDVAIRGKGFFVVTTGKGRGAEHLRFTRDGRFALNPRGELVMAASGMPVLGENDQTITLTNGAGVRIDASGVVRENGARVGRIQVVVIPDNGSIHKAGDNVFMANGNAQVNRRPAAARLEQGFIEASAVDPILSLNAMINATKAVQANIKMIQFHDNLMDQAINRLGRVA